MRRFGHFRPEVPEIERAGLNPLSASSSPVLQLPNLSDQELTKVELPVGDEALNQDPHLVAIEPYERLACVECRLVQPDRRRHHRR